MLGGMDKTGKANVLEEITAAEFGIPKDDYDSSRRGAPTALYPPLGEFVLALGRYLGVREIIVKYIHVDGWVSRSICNCLKAGGAG